MKRLLLVLFLATFLLGATAPAYAAPGGEITPDIECHPDPIHWIW
ncbi:MAG: hypothetical protein QJR00_05905 [Bacillota bacterium]|nr:hypothetical protein [Bacillota bacterium]